MRGNHIQFEICLGIVNLEQHWTGGYYPLVQLIVRMIEVIIVAFIVEMEDVNTPCLH